MAARWCRGRGQGGLATVELVLVLPVVFAVIMTAVQFGVWAHAAHIANAAASEGVRAARAEDGSAAAGRSRAEAFLGNLGSNVLEGATVRAVRGVDVARVEVEGRATAVVPGLRLPVKAAAQGPVERYRPAGGP